MDASVTDKWSKQFLVPFTVSRLVMRVKGIDTERVPCWWQVLDGVKINNKNRCARAMGRVFEMVSSSLEKHQHFSWRRTIAGPNEGEIWASRMLSTSVIWAHFMWRALRPFTCDALHHAIDAARIDGCVYVGSYRYTRFDSRHSNTIGPLFLSKSHFLLINIYCMKRFNVK